MNGNLMLDPDNNIALFYGSPLGFTPDWASIDVAQGEIFIANNDESGEGKHIIVNKIKQTIYEKIQEDTQIYLVEFTDNDYNKPKEAIWVPLMIAHQIYGNKI